MRTGHIHSRSRDRVMSRGPRAVPPAWREQQRDRITSESRVFRSYETRVSSDSLPAGMKYVMEASAGYVMHFFLQLGGKAVAGTPTISFLVRGTIFVENLPPGTTSKDLLVSFAQISVQPPSKTDHRALLFQEFFSAVRLRGCCTLPFHSAHS